MKMTKIIVILVLLMAIFQTPLALAGDTLTVVDIRQIKQLIAQFYPKSDLSKFESGVPHSEVSPCFFCKSHQEYRDLFIPSIARLLTQPTDDPNELTFCIDYGVIIKGQDFSIKDFTVSEPFYLQGEVNVAINFKNFDEPQKFVFTFQRNVDKTRNMIGWGVKEIQTTGYRFSQELARCISPKKTTKVPQQ